MSETAIPQHIALLNESDASLIRHLTSNEDFMSLFRSISPQDREKYFEKPEKEANFSVKCTDSMLDMVHGLSVPFEIRSELERQVLVEISALRNRPSASGDRMHVSLKAEKIIEMDRKLVREFRTYNNLLPLSIWHCCESGCFATLAADPEKVVAFDEIIRIHEIAAYHREKVGDISYLVQTRRRGVGGSSMVGCFPSRSEREQNSGTDREKALERLGEYVSDVLPFLCGIADSRTGVPKLQRKLCVHAISCLLDVSYNFIYKRKLALAGLPSTTNEVIDSIIDTVGVRMRKHRRMGKRSGFPAIADLPSYECGCLTPCFATAPLELLQKWYNEFKKCSQQLHSRRKENQYLLEHLMCPMLNRTVSFCNKSLSALFTVSVHKIADVRSTLESICKEPTIDSAPIMEEAVTGYRYRNGHPMTHLNRVVREKVETYLDMTLRPDPGASDGVNTCRVYSPEINTQEKLRKLLAQQLQDDEVLKNPLSSTTLQRMIQSYLDSKNCKLSFTQSDHNACPSCKAMKYAVLQFSLERKQLAKELANVSKGPRPYTLKGFDNINKLTLSIKEKEDHENTCFEEMNSHVDRDSRIRQFLKRLTDVFRAAERERQEEEREEEEVLVNGWCDRKDQAIITHQDDMTKVDLPSFIVNASSDITRWRYDINAHVNAVTGDCVVFSHEQGSGAKDSSSIFELILLDHILRCRGEAVKFIVSDNAAVGKNWLTTIALPQYLVDQGFAEIAVIVFLENNHGKWLADMLFGQFQLRKRRSTVPGVDSLLSEFECINKRNGLVRGFVVNPLSSVKFEKVLKSLGYITKPPQDFGFVKRNIHFATACAEGAKRRLSSGLKNLMGEMLPTEAGVVRICSDPPSHKPQRQLPFQRRYFDIPAASRNTSCEPLENASEALVVAKNQPFAEKGNCVVSSRNMDKVGYNGYVFRAQKAYPELQNPETPLVKQTWPPGLITLQNMEGSDGSEPLVDSEHLKCAPENWILRRPVRHFRNDDNDFVSRYPPRSMLNAKYRNGPRSEYAHSTVHWKPTRTYSEPPVPLSFSKELHDTCAFWALSDLKELHMNDNNSLTMLDLLKSVFSRMGDRQASDPYLHKAATKASRAAWENYEEALRLFKRRESGHPKPVKTVKQVFREDPDIKAEVERLMQETGDRNKRNAGKIVSSLFEKAAAVPGGLDRFEWLAAKDLERFAKEKNYFTQVVQKQFDEENGLSPVIS